MNNKLSSDVINRLSFLTLKEMQIILNRFNDRYGNDYYNTWKYIAKTYTDEQITPLLPTLAVHKTMDKRTSEEKLNRLKSYYVKNSDNIVINTSDIPILKRGRSKNKEGTLKDKVFDVLNNHYDTENIELSYEEILNNGILNIAENTFKTILSQWRKERGIKCKRGRKVKNV